MLVITLELNYLCEGVKNFPSSVTFCAASLLTRRDYDKMKDLLPYFTSAFLLSISGTANRRENLYYGRKDTL